MWPTHFSADAPCMPRRSGCTSKSLCCCKPDRQHPGYGRVDHTECHDFDHRPSRMRAWPALACS